MTSSPRILLLCLALSVLLGTASAHAVSLPILIDGDFSDWTGGAQVATDPSGDAGGTGIDFTTLSAANDDDWLYLRFDTTVEIQPDEGQDVILAIDTDANAATGQSIGGIGAELVWELGLRNGTFYSPGATNIDHPDIGLVVGPTVSGTQFELALDRSAQPNGSDDLFPNDTIHIALIDNNSGDVMTMGAPGYTFSIGSQPVPNIGLGRDAADHVRIASYNIENDGLFDGGSTEDAQNRIFDAIDPDVWVINEAWSHSASQVAAQVEVLLPSGPGESWTGLKLDSGNVIVSRFPILDSWEVNPGDRITAALLDLRPTHDSDLLVVANHWSCCTADANRQRQADALIAFLRDARTPGGVIDLAVDTPIVSAGDYNLVGWSSQLTTLLTGDIDDNGTWGADSAPDWDGSDFESVTPRHPDARFVYTWRKDTSSFYPGQLDWIVYSGSAVSLHNSFVVETRTMTPTSLATAGLNADDTVDASDHAPLVADFVPVSSTVGIGDDPAVAPRMMANHPNPFRGSTTIRFSLEEPGAARIQVHDLRGRMIRVLETGDLLGAGQHAVSWDGRDQAGRDVPAGVYFYRAVLGGVDYSGRMTLLR